MHSLARGRGVGRAAAQTVRAGAATRSWLARLPRTQTRLGTADTVPLEQFGHRGVRVSAAVSLNGRDLGRTGSTFGHSARACFVPAFTAIRGPAAVAHDRAATRRQMRNPESTRRCRDPPSRQLGLKRVAGKHPNRARRARASMEVPKQDARHSPRRWNSVTKECGRSMRNSAIRICGTDARRVPGASEVPFRNERAVRGNVLVARFDRFPSDF